MLGALPSQMIQELIENECIKKTDIKNIQPASLDLTISDEIYKLQGVALPKKGETIQELIKATKGRKETLEHPLECRGVYLCKLNEEMELPEAIFGYTNNKSSSGRINLQVRVICEGVEAFDRIPRGYKGQLWVMISSLSFATKLTAGEALNQIRLFNAETRLTGEEHRTLNQAHQLLYGTTQLLAREEVLIEQDGGITMTLNLTGDHTGYVAHEQPDKVIDYAKRDHDPEEYFQVIKGSRDKKLLLNRHAFYIFATKEAISIPREYAVEMIPYDPAKGEFRSHYAGFFDPGWGYGEKGKRKGTPAVLEVYPYEHQIVFRDGQPICKMAYERLATIPSLTYGVEEELNSHYSTQTISTALSKHFRK